jgi:hypothetical protein
VGNASLPSSTTTGTFPIRQQKTNAEVDIPVLPELQEVLDATPSGHLTFLVTEHGKPFTAAGFGNWFRDMCAGAGLPRRLSAHGLRKAAATRFADHGATAHELMAWFGWKKITEAERYTVRPTARRSPMEWFGSSDREQKCQTSQPGLTFWGNNSATSMRTNRGGDPGRFEPATFSLEVSFRASTRLRAHKLTYAKSRT